MTISGYYGFGQSITTLEMDMAVKAVYNEMIGQTFAVLGMAIAKISLGIFLLRIVVKQWHRISIWISMVSLAIVSVMTAILFWIQKLPSESIYDPRVPGRLVVKVTPFSILLGCEPPLVLRDPLHCQCGLSNIILFISLVRRRGLLLCTASMDFHLEAQYEVQGEDVDCNQFEPGIHVRFPSHVSHYGKTDLDLFHRACVCGIIRTVDLGGLNSSNYTRMTRLPSQHIR
jgi:hypothetical protein